MAPEKSDIAKLYLGALFTFHILPTSYWLISDKLHDLVTKVDIIPSIKTDHSAIFLELEEIESSGRGAGFWKLNTSLLTNENYKRMITNSLPTWLEAGKDYMPQDCCGTGSSLT